MSDKSKVLIISDIHGNAEALRAVMTAEGDADRVVFLGDAFVSGPQPIETAKLLEHLEADVSIMGNHDKEVLDVNLFAHWPEGWIALNEWIIESLGREVIDRVRAFKPAGEYQVGGISMYLHHGELEKGVPSPLPDSPAESFLAMGSESRCPLVLFGHTHVQFTRTIGEKTYINPGSVGQPRCGKLHACYGVFESGRYSPRQVTYDPGPWIEALESLEVLNNRLSMREWLKTALLSGYGIGEKEPWTRYHAEGYA